MATNVLAQPATAYIQGEQLGQQRMQSQQGFDLSQQINQENINAMRQKGATEAAQARATHEASILGAVLNQPPETQQQAFDAVANELHPNTLKMFGADAAGRVAFNPNRAKMLIDMARTFSQLPPEKITAEIANYRFEKGLPTTEEQAAFKSWKRETPAEAAAKKTAEEGAKLEVQSKLLPKIRADIQRAETQAKESGIQLSELGRAKAALPGLQEVVNKLKSLADIATYTQTGQIFDLASKELGFGATRGGTARAKMISIVDNQVLPLLRDTFGAAFTAAEGERLRNTLLDPNQTPEAKKASLDVFLEQKIRNIETKEREVSGQIPSAAPQQGITVTAPNGQVFTFPDQQSADNFKRAAGIQ